MVVSGRCGLLDYLWDSIPGALAENGTAGGLLARDLAHWIRIVSTDELHYESVQRLRKCVEYQAIMANGIGLLKTGLDNTQAKGEIQHQDLLEKLGAVADGIGQKIGSMGSQLTDGLGTINEAAFADIAKQMMDSLHNGTRQSRSGESNRGRQHDFGNGGPHLLPERGGG